jgi:hypothetical protein
MSTITLTCRDCGYTSDFSALQIGQNTIPRHCPECSGTLYYDGTDTEWDEDTYRAEGGDA